MLDMHGTSGEGSSVGISHLDYSFAGSHSLVHRAGMANPLHSKNEFHDEVMLIIITQWSSHRWSSNRIILLWRGGLTCTTIAILPFLAFMMVSFYVVAPHPCKHRKGLGAELW